MWRGGRPLRRPRCLVLKLLLRRDCEWLAFFGDHAIEDLGRCGGTLILGLMDVLRWIEGYFACLQLERLLVIRLEPERSFQHVNGLITGVIMPGSDCARAKITDEHDDFLPLHSAHWLAQEFGPRDLWRTLRAHICGPACS